MEYSIQPIGPITSCFREKFGIPRQPGLVKSAQGAVELFPPCDREEMFTGLESFSHIWLQFLFHEAVADGWRPKVRPPWLGGKKRVGLFASRSPHRPNFLGLSVVRNKGLRKTKGRLYLDISELDLLDGTPVVDIKPYIPYSDRLDTATSGFVQFAEEQVDVVFTADAAFACQCYQQSYGRDLEKLITEVLGQDPRPASQRCKQREYGMLLWEMNIRWLAENRHFTVFSVKKKGRENI